MNTAALKQRAKSLEFQEYALAIGRETRSSHPSRRMTAVTPEGPRFFCAPA